VVNAACLAGGEIDREQRAERVVDEHHARAVEVDQRSNE
jgi:hypothetical protein